MLASILVVIGGRPWGFLEWFFVGLLAVLVAIVGLFFLYLVAQLFLNPGRRERRL